MYSCSISLIPCYHFLLPIICLVWIYFIFKVDIFSLLLNPELLREREMIIYLEDPWHTVGPQGKGDVRGKVAPIKHTCWVRCCSGQ